MGLQEIQNERFENSEYWPKQDSEVLKYSTDKHDVSLPLPVAADEINKNEECNHRSLRPGRAVNQDTIKAPSRPAPAPPRTGRGYKTTPKWGIKPPPTPFLAIFDPWGGFMPPGGGFIPPFAGVGLSPKGVVLSPHLVIGGVLSPLWGGFIPHFW